MKLDSLQKELSYAEFAMNKWMEEFNMDSALNNAKERIDYLHSEKLKVTKVKESILSSLQKADSLIKAKFKHLRVVHRTGVNDEVHACKAAAHFVQSQDRQKEDCV